MTNKRICVVLVIDDLGYGGTERQVVQLANSMDQERFDVHVCTLSNHVPLGKQLRDAERKLHTIVKKNRVDFTVVPRLARLLKSLNADIVHSYLFSADIASRLAGRLAGTELIIGSERSANYSPKKRNILAYRLTRGCVDLTIANSKAGAQFNSITYGRPASDYRVVYNGVDTERFTPMDGTTIRRRLGISSQCSVVGAFANFKKSKNHAMLLRAFELVLDVFPEARLLLVGDQVVDNRYESNGYKAQLDRMVDDLGIRHRCVFLGHQDSVEQLYPVCDITVLSSLHEGTPNVLLESMACGVPVVATNVCDNEYIVREGEVGHLVAVGDEAGMAHHMKSLLGNPALRNEMGQKARQWMVNEFSTRRLAEKVATVYVEALKKADT